VKLSGIVGVEIEEVAPPEPNPEPEPLVSFGAGPNAPDWAGKTVYPEELFLSPIPVSPSPANAAGFRGYQGFPGTAAYEHTYVSYPVVSTPIGTKPVLRQHFNGTTKNITGVEQSTDNWAAGPAVQNAGWSVRVSGTWAGTLVFELSTDGGTTWNAHSLTGTVTQGGVTGTSTSANGSWRQENGSAAGSLFRVRASSWTSGTAKVDVGKAGGQSAGRFDAGDFTGDPTRFYTRSLIYVSTNWDNSNNVGTKWLFFRDPGSQNNHYYNLLFGTLSTVRADISLQNPIGGSFNFQGSAGPAFGNWIDVETLMIANTPGVANGVGKMWINGALLLDRSDIKYFQTTDIPRTRLLFADATYGGGFSPPDKNIFFDSAAMYRESAP
jgi:hypothetical protein